MNTFLKKISCGSNFTIEFPSAVKLEFGIAADDYISFIVSERGAGKRVVFEAGKLAGHPYENWSLEIVPSELNCNLPDQIFENNNIYDYRIGVYSDSAEGKEAFYIECFLLTQDIFSFDDVAYKAVVLSYAPGYYKEDSTDSGVQSVRIPFHDYKTNLEIDSKYLNPENTAIFGFDYVIGQHGGNDNLVFKSGSYELSYDEITGLWYIPASKLRDGVWNYEAQINPVSWTFSTQFGWLDDEYLNAETGVAVHSYRRGFSYADEPSASGWTFGSEQSSNFNYQYGIQANPIYDESGHFIGGTNHFQKLSELKRAIDVGFLSRYSVPDWEFFKSQYYDRYNIRGFQLNGVERTVDGSAYSLATINSPIISMDEELSVFIQGVELDTGGNSNLKQSICKDDLLHWTAVLDAQSRSVNVDWTIPEGYTAHWAYDGYYKQHQFSPSDFQPFDFDLDVPVGVGCCYYEDKHSSSWSTDNPDLQPITKNWALSQMYLESDGTYWVLAGFTRGGSTRFIQEGDVSGNIIDIASEPNHYLWNVGDIIGEWGEHITGENLLLNNLDGNGTIYPVWGRARAVTLTFSFDESSSEESSYVPPVESSASSEESSMDSSSSSWNEDWATEGYLQDKLQSFVDYLGQIGKTAVSQNIVSAGEIVSALDIIMSNVGGLETYSSSTANAGSGEVVLIGQVQNSFNEIERRFNQVADMAFAYGNLQFTQISQFSGALVGLNGALVADHSEAPVISGGSGEIAFKADVDDALNAKISKYISIAESVLAIKSGFDSATSVGLDYLGSIVSEVCEVLKDFGANTTRESSRNVAKPTYVKSENVFSNADVLIQTEEKDVAITRASTRTLTLAGEIWGGVQVGIIDWGSEATDQSKRYGWFDSENVSASYLETYGKKTIKLIVPTFVNFKQAQELNWNLAWYSIFNGSAMDAPLLYDELGIRIDDLNLSYFNYGTIGVESVVSDDESVAFGCLAAMAYQINQDLRKFSTQQKVVPATTLFNGQQQGWNFENLRELNILNPNLEFEDRGGANHLSYIGTNVRRTAPFPEWQAIYIFAGIGTKIVVSLGMTDLMALQGFPFGAATKHYFKCLDSNGSGLDAGYVIYDGTQWITWRSLIPEDYFGPIPSWPDDVIDADNKYLNLTYNSNMDHGVVGQIPDWNNVESADSTFRVDGNNGESPVCTSPGVWRQTRDTSSVYGAIPEWKNVTSAKGTYYNQGFLDTVWDITRPFSEIMPSTVAHDENTVKGTSFALRAYFTSAWGGMLEEIDILMGQSNSPGCVFCVKSSHSVGRIYTSIVYGYLGSFLLMYWYGYHLSSNQSGGVIWMDVPSQNNDYVVLMYVNGVGSDQNITLNSQGGAHIEAIVGCSDFGDMNWELSVKASVRRVNVCSVNHDVSGFEDFTELTIVEIIPGTTTSGQHILDNCFKNCGKLETVILPNCTTVGAEAFNGCGKVSSVKLGMVSLFGENCFSGIGVDLIEN